MSSAELKPALIHVLDKIVQQVRTLPNKIAIGGHTDARPYRNNAFYSNWELSAARALNARRAMENKGLPAGLVERVVGYADSSPLVPSDPLNPANRRISILILRDTPAPTAPVQQQAAGDQHRVRDGGAAAGADIDLAGAAFGVQPAHAPHLGRVPDFFDPLMLQVSERRAVEHVALAAGVHISILLHVDRSAP